MARRRASRAKMARSPGRQGCARAHGARVKPPGAGYRRATQCRPDCARLRARLSRLSFRPELADRASAPGRLAGRFCRARAGLCRNGADGINGSPPKSELMVHTGAQQIGMERHVDSDESGAAIQSAIKVAEVDIKIFDFRG